MKSPYLLLAVCLAAATGFLIATDPLSLALAGLGAAVLLIAVWQKHNLLASLGFMMLVFAASLQAWEGSESQARLALSSLCASLAAWDIASYAALLRRLAVPLDPRSLRRRLLRLGFVILCGWVLGALALFFELTLRFELLLALLLFVVLSLSVSMMYSRQRDGTPR